MIAWLIGALVASWTLFGALVVYVFAFPEKAARVYGWALGFLAWTGTKVRHRSIKSSLEGQISDFARSVDREAAGTMPYNLQLRFVSEVERAELDSERKTVIVRIRDRVHDDKNLVHAMLVYSSVAVLPQARVFLEDHLRDAVDLTITRKLLNSLKHHSAVQYLQKDLLPCLIETKPELDYYCTTLDVLDERGYFSRILLPELRDFGASIESRYPREQHHEESAGLVEYLYQVATRQPGVELPEPGYSGHYAATAIVFVGIGEKMHDIGEAPYVNHLRWLRDHGYRKAYLQGRGDPNRQRVTLSMRMPERIATVAEDFHVAKRGRTMRFDAVDQEGKNRPNVLIEMAIAAPNIPSQIEESPPLPEVVATN